MLDTCEICLCLLGEMVEDTDIHFTLMSLS
jgi:hypothetical protein